MLAHQTQHILEICFTILILLMYNQRFIDFFILKIHCSVLLCILIAQETLVFRYGSVVQTTSESSADRLKVDRTAESNRIHIFGNDSDQGRRIQILQIFNPFFDTTFLLKS